MFAPHMACLQKPDGKGRNPLGKQCFGTHDISNHYEENTAIWQNRTKNSHRNL